MGFRPRQLIGEMDRRLPEQGRIRLGQKVATAKGGTRPDKLHTLRFTSSDRDALAKVAELYGGEVVAWEDSWEVVTEAHEVQVVLPADPLGGTPIYELWSRGGLDRRCDGEVCTTPRRVGNQPDDVEYDEVPCLCNAKKLEECKPKTRLKVILPQLPFGGVWRLETGSWNAAQELPGMVDAVQAVTTGGFVKAFLGVRDEERMIAGKKKEFIVPYLRLDTSLIDALGGGAGLMSIGPAQGPRPAALEAAAPVDSAAPQPAPAVTDDDEPVDAEVVPDADALAERAMNLGVEPHVWSKALDTVGAPQTGELSLGEIDRLSAMLDKLAAGTHSLAVRDDRVALVRTAPA